MNPGKLFTTVEATMDLKPLMCPVPFPEGMPFSTASEVQVSSVKFQAEHAGGDFTKTGSGDIHRIQLISTICSCRESELWPVEYMSLLYFIVSEAANATCPWWLAECMPLSAKSKI